MMEIFAWLLCPFSTPAAARRHGEEQIVLEGMSGEQALARILANA